MRLASISKSALVPYSAHAMYELVNDIESYPEFLPWCTSAKVHFRDEDEVRATITLARSGIHKSFTTCNRLQKNKMIEVRLVQGPFRHLEGFWRFNPLRDNACKVSLDLEFEFSGRLVSMAFGPIFHQVANTLVDAFTRRAARVHGKS